MASHPSSSKQRHRKKSEGVWEQGCVNRSGVLLQKPAYGWCLRCHSQHMHVVGRRQAACMLQITCEQDLGAEKQGMRSWSEPGETSGVELERVCTPICMQTPLVPHPLGPQSSDKLGCTCPNAHSPQTCCTHRILPSRSTACLHHQHSGKRQPKRTAHKPLKSSEGCGVLPGASDCVCRAESQMRVTSASHEE